MLLGIGIDSVEVDRFAGMLERRRGLAERLFSPAEREYAARLASPAGSLAGRFAAKEAAMKALGVGLGAFGWWDVEVARREGGRPELLVGGRAAELAAARGVKRWQISLTHTDLMASAVVAALG